MLYTGLDYHRSFSYITTMNERGEILSQKKLPSNGEILGFLKEFGGEMEVAIEVTPSWYWLYDQLEDEGFEVKLSPPLKTKAIAYAKVKTDKVDSATLAHLLRSNLLPLSYVPDKSVRLNREQLKLNYTLTASWAISSRASTTSSTTSDVSPVRTIIRSSVDGKASVPVSL